jgi:hypothetical protein
MRARFLLLALAATLSAHAKSVPLENVSLQWKPTSELKLSTMQMPSGTIQFETFQDERNHKEAIGENLEDERPKPVTTADDVGAFVGSHMRGAEVLSDAIVNTVSSLLESAEFQKALSGH